jgi:hypothetical protein
MFTICTNVFRIKFHVKENYLFDAIWGLPFFIPVTIFGRIDEVLPEVHVE